MIPPVYESVRTLETSKRPAADACYEWMRRRDWKACKGRCKREKERGEGGKKKDGKVCV